MRLIVFSIFSFLFVSSAMAECFPIRRIMDASSRANFRNLCQAAVQCDPACQGIEPSKLINCAATQDSNKLMNTENIGRKFLTCARAFFVDSMVDLANTIMSLIKTLVGGAVDSVTNIIKFMTDSDFRQRTMSRGSQMSSLGTAFLESSARNFGTEYSKNFTAARRRVGILNAPLAALGDTLVKPFIKMVTDLMSQIAHNQISQFRCLNSAAKQEAICAMAGGLLMPPTVLFGLLKTGINGVRSVRGIDGFLTNARQTFAARTRPTPAPSMRLSGRSATRTSTPAPATSTRRTSPRRETTSVTATTTPSPNRSRTPTPDAELRRVGALEDTARLTEAESVLRRALTQEEKKAILDAHYIGIKDADGNLLALSERRGFGTYTPADIRQKAEQLYAAGFSKEEVRTLMERGVAGAPASEISQYLAEAVMANARRKALMDGDPSNLTYNPSVRPGIVQSSDTIKEVQFESYVATRGFQRVAREVEGDEAILAARQAIDSSVTSMDSELIFESVNMYQTRGGDMSLLVSSNKTRLDEIRMQATKNPTNGVLRDEIFAREQINKKFGPPEVAVITPEVVNVAPKQIPTPFRFNSNTGEFSDPNMRRVYDRSILNDATKSLDALKAATRAETNAPLFITTKHTLDTFFDNGWPRKMNANGNVVTQLDRADELRSLQALNQNFFKALVTNNSGFTRSLSQEYRARAWGGNYSAFERAERNLHARIRELGGTP